VLFLNQDFLLLFLMKESCDRDKFDAPCLGIFDKAALAVYGFDRLGNFNNVSWIWARQ
jgi:hypothetical protein